jgi:hypothetical protein
MGRHLDETLLPAQDLQACPRMPRWAALLMALAIVAGTWFCVRDRLQPPPKPGARGGSQQPVQRTVPPGH